MSNVLSARTGSRPALSPLIVACLAATWFIWGSSYLAIKFALTGFPPFFMMGSRFLVAGTLLIVLVRWRGTPMPTWWQWRNALVTGTLMLGAGMGLSARAELTVGSGLVVAFIAITPVTMNVFNLGYRIYPSGREVVGMLIGLTGVLMLSQGADYRASPAGLADVSIAVLAWSLGSVASQQGLHLAPEPMGSATGMLCGGAVLLVFSALSGEQFTSSPPAIAWLALAYLVLFGSLIAFSAYMLLLARVRSSVASSYTCVNPLVAMVLGVAVGHEYVSTWEWISAGVALFGVMLLLLGTPAESGRGGARRLSAR
jgi:drug/metabolite transporter (DMT)-like permease